MDALRCSLSWVGVAVSVLFLVDAAAANESVQNHERIRLATSQEIAKHFTVPSDARGTGSLQKAGEEFVPVGEWILYYGESDVMQIRERYSASGELVGASYWAPNGELVRQSISKAWLLGSVHREAVVITRYPWLWGEASQSEGTMDWRFVRLVYIDLLAIPPRDARVEGTDFSGADLTGVDLSRVTGLSTRQVVEALAWDLDASPPTRVPDAVSSRLDAMGLRRGRTRAATKQELCEHFALTDAAKVSGRVSISPDPRSETLKVGHWTIYYGESDVIHTRERYFADGRLEGASYWNSDGALVAQSIGCQLLTGQLDGGAANASVLYRPPWLWGEKHQGKGTKDWRFVGLHLQPLSTMDTSEAIVSGACFAGVDLVGVDLSAVHGLSVEQVLQALDWSLDDGSTPSAFPPGVADELQGLGLRSGRLSRPATQIELAEHFDLPVQARMSGRLHTVTRRRGRPAPVGLWTVYYGRSNVLSIRERYESDGRLVGCTYWDPRGRIAEQWVGAEDDHRGFGVNRFSGPPWLWKEGSQGVETIDLRFVSLGFLDGQLLGVPGAAMEGSRLDGVDLTGVDLSLVDGLTVGQVLQARAWDMDASPPTRFPQMIEHALNRLELRRR